VLGIEVEAEASGVGGNLKITGPSTSGDISTKVSLYGAALGGAFGSFSDKMEAEVGSAFISYNQSTTRFEVSKAVGSLGLGAAHPITPNLSVFIDYRYTALGPEWAHGRQIDITRGDLRNPMYVSSATCRRELEVRSRHVTSRKGEATESRLAGGCHYSAAACSISRMSSSESPK
jgi:hypothetical protein